MKRLECLDGLRGVLAVYVMLGHMAPFAAIPAWIADALSHGGAAVDLFFALSGLVIVRSLEAVRYRARPFLIARVARIFPVFLATFAVAVAVQAMPTRLDTMPWIAADSLARGMWSEGWPRAWAIEIAAHLTMTHGLFPNGVLPHVWVSFLGSAWSLSTEWQFYLAVLVLGWWLGRGPSGPRRLAWIFLGMAAAGLAWQALAPEAWAFSRAFLPNRAQYFALGIASASLVRGAAGPVAWRPYLPVLVATLALCAAQGRADKLLPPLAWTLCLGAECRPRWPGLRLLAAVLRARLTTWFGALSYCIYLANEPVQKLLGGTLALLAGGDAVLFTALWLPGAVGLPLLVAAGLHAWLEQPALRWGKARAAIAASDPARRPGWRAPRLCRRDGAGYTQGQ